MRKDETALTQLAAATVQLQQQIEQMNQRLDMIYRVVTRLVEAKLTTQPPAAADHLAREWSALQPAAAAGRSFSTHALLDPGSMLASLHQHALNAGLAVAFDSIERLQAELPISKDADQQCDSAS